MLSSGGETRRRAIWYIQQIGADEVFPEAARLLVESDDYDDHRAVLNAMRGYGDRLEGAAPNWYLMLDDYINLDRPADILIQIIELAAAWKEHRLMPALTRLAQHPDESVRSAAFRGMASFANDLLIPTLLRLYSSDRAILKVYALEGMEQFPDSRLQKFILEALSSPSKSVRIYAAAALAAQSDAENQSQYLARQFGDDSDPEVRERIVELIGRYRWRRQSSIVARAMADDSPLVRGAALEASLLLEDRSLAIAIARQQERELDGTLKLRSIYCLLRLDSSGGGRGLAAMLTGDQDELVRAQAASAIGILNEREALGALLRALQDDANEHVRLEAAGALARLADGRSLGGLADSVRRENEVMSVRAAAAMAIAAIGNRESRQQLARLSSELPPGEMRRRVQNVLLRLRE